MRDPGGDHGKQEADIVGPDGTVVVGRLKRRADFLRAAKGKRWHGRAFSLQASRSRDDGTDGARIGLTVTKKVGNAVIRNRARRRLREAIRIHPAMTVQAARDYVLVVRLEAIRLPFSALQDDLAEAFRRIDAFSRAKGQPQHMAKRSSRSDADGRRKS